MPRPSDQLTLPATTYRILLRFIAAGIPAPQGSKRHVGAGRMIETSKNLPAWRQALIAAATTAQKAQNTAWEPINTPVTVRAVFHLPRPQKTKYGPLPAGVPDLDKLARAVGDGLTHSGTLTDDARITGWITHKYWATTHNQPGAKIDILTPQEPTP